jgi:hypothetical protein
MEPNRVPLTLAEFIQRQQPTIVRRVCTVERMTTRNLGLRMGIRLTHALLYLTLDHPYCIQHDRLPILATRRENRTNEYEHVL